MIPYSDALRLVLDYDYVHDARCELDVRDLFTQVAIKPGKPNIFGLDRRPKPAKKCRP